MTTNEISEHARTQLPILRGMREHHLRVCRFCERREDCDVIRGYDNSIGWFEHRVDRMEGEL